MQKPQSCTSFPINLAALATFFATLYYLVNGAHTLSPAMMAVVACVSVVVPLVVLEYFFLRPPLLQPKTTHRKHKVNRVLTKLVGLYVVWALIACGYWMIPEYDAAKYQVFWYVLLPVLPALFVLSVPYFFFVDRRMKQPEDGYYVLGAWVTGQGKFQKEQSIQLMLGWLVKAFFLPLMWLALVDSIHWLQKINWVSATASYSQMFTYMWKFLFAMELPFVVVGYVFAMRVFDSHIRSAEPTLLGWVAALSCYPPFNGVVFDKILTYNADKYYWGNWLEHGSYLYIGWGSVILLLLLIYALASVMFGLRFSNLTHRGIITNGVYRYSKHPAYISKNIIWWLVAVPFVNATGDWKGIVQGCVLLLLVNGLYFLRAKTEEWHLRQDPLYQEYTAWIAEHGVFARIKKMVF